MPHIAFLRAINVGGRFVKMERLRALFVEMGYADVTTFIASGNVIFDGGRAKGERLERAIERHLADALGYEVATFLRTPAELTSVVRHRPFGDEEPDTEGGLYVGFFGAPIDAARKRAVMALQSDANQLHVHGRELYWLRRERTMQTIALGTKLERALGTPATFRNVTTVRKLAALYG